MEKFKELVKENIKRYLTQDYQKGEVILKDFVFSGDERLCLAVIMDTKMHIPALDLEEYFKKINRGVSSETVLHEIASDYQNLRQYETREHVVSMDMEEFLGHLHVAVLNYQKYREKLGDIPYIKMNDLAVIPMLKLPTGKSIVVRREMTEVIQIAEDKLLGIAMKNHSALLKPVIVSVSSIMEGEAMNIPLDDKKALPQSEAFYILTNEDHEFGAAGMVDKELLSQLGEKLGDDFYIIPININELMITPKKNINHPSAMKQTLMTPWVNSRSKKDFLSDNLYLYNTKIREVCIYSETLHKETARSRPDHDER